MGRRAFVNVALLMGVAPRASALSSLPNVAPTSAELRRALVERRALHEADRSMVDVDSLLDAYVAQHPPIEPAIRARGELAAGTWRVVHAPHIERLAGVLGAQVCREDAVPSRACPFLPLLFTPRGEAAQLTRAAPTAAPDATPSHSLT